MSYVDPSAPPGRCPDLTDIGINAAKRVSGTDAKTYLIESLYEPAKYLVPGYGKIMPEVWKATDCALPNWKLRRLLPTSRAKVARLTRLHLMNL